MHSTTTDAAASALARKIRMQTAILMRPVSSRACVNKRIARQMLVFFFFSVAKKANVPDACATVSRSRVAQIVAVAGGSRLIHCVCVCAFI